jgi:hypothetical protein
MPKAVVNGAMLQCTCGTAPAALIVTSQSAVKIGGQLAATTMDNAFTANIPPFGPCSALTAKASGVSTPCAMVAGGPWAPGSTSVVNIGNKKGLLDTDKLNCTVGPGVISVSNPGQPQTNDA